MLNLNTLRELNVVTSKDLPVRFYATDGSGEHPIHGAVKTATGWHLAAWSNRGRPKQSSHGAIVLRAGREGVGGPYFIKYPMRGFYWLATPVGPAFTSDKRRARIFWTKREAAETMRRSPLAFTACEIVKAPL